ncbi:MAG: hypothetical protein Q7T16_06245 [Candidatus Burarchaeum sp.]|nr:hypothetical protein [Candidatus Burarchaeum sp.]MDO8340229.1 hypothetical protein [Candidatus Burarchaeum sp.]
MNKSRHDGRDAARARKGIFTFGSAQASGAHRGIFTFEDFILALVILSIATALVISNLFIFDHRTVEQMLAARTAWGSDSAADMIVKKYMAGSGELELGALRDRPMPDRVQVTVGALRFGSEAPLASEVFVSNRLVFMNGRAELLTVKTW